MLKNLKVRTQLVFGFAFVFLLGAFIAAIGIINMAKMHGQEDVMYEKELLGLSYIKDANLALIYLGRGRGNLLLATTDAERQRQVDLRKKYSEMLKSHIEKARPLFSSDRAKVLFAEFDTTWLRYDATMEKIYGTVAPGEPSQADIELAKLLVEARRHADMMEAQLSELSRQKEARAKATAEENQALYESSRNTMLLLLALGAIASLVISTLITRSITRPLHEAVKLARTVAAGDLTSRITLESNNEFGELLGALGEMNASLARIVSQVRAGTEVIATASGEIASGNMDLSSRTEEQASSLEETASSLEELTSTVKHNAENALQADQLAKSASAVAAKGGAVVSEVVETMGAINASSRQISDIIGVIDGIAFQTNILALNAAVEAARAGEQGRGFAVVASEVRSLAQRSAAAAREIKELIVNSVAKVDAGTKLVDQAGATMQEVVDGIQRVTSLMTEIAAASREQSAGIEQVNLAVSQMDEVTQQNAALVEESAAAAQSLQDQAGKLTDLVGAFRLEPARSDAAPARSAPAVAREEKRTVARRDAPVIQKQKRKMIVASAAGDDWEEF